MLGVNIGVPAPVAWFPFSGWKDSIDGDLHANGKDAVDFYTRKKVVTSRLVNGFAIRSRPRAAAQHKSLRPSAFAPK